VWPATQITVITVKRDGVAHSQKQIRVAGEYVGGISDDADNFVDSHLGVAHCYVWKVGLCDPN
jgi:hypothetical protein